MSGPCGDHPSLDLLTAFASGAVPTGEIDSIAGHLETCATCVAAIETLPADRLILLVRTYRESAGLPPPAALCDHPRYRVLEYLGRGGMGAVYKAEHRHLGRQVALKVIRSDLVSRPEVAQRFHREAKAAGRLSHPNVVAALDADQAGEVHYLVTEFVEGATLAQVVAERGPLCVATACNYASQAALGLQHAFERGMVHRDIHPGNLMLSVEGTVKILDFGLARFSEGVGSEGSVTSAGTVLGTPDYLAPEQVRDARRADIRADIYGLGGTLYFLLTGHSPYPEGSLVEKMVCHLAGRLRPLKKLRPEIPAALERLVERMMAKDPDQRFQTPAEVQAALAPFVDQERSASAIACAKGRGWRRLAWLGVGVAAMLAAVGLLYVITFRAHPPDAQEPEPETAARGPGGNEPAEADVADSAQIARLVGNTELVRSVAVSPDGRHVVSGSYDATLRVWDVASRSESHRYRHDDWIAMAGFSPDGRQVVFGGGDTIGVARLDPPQVAAVLRRPRHRVTAVAFTEGGQVFSAGLDDTVCRWDAAKRRQVDSFAVGALLFVQFSGDARFMLYSAGGFRARFWDVGARKQLCTLEGHTGKIRCVALSADARRGLSGGDDATIRFWSLEDGKPLGVLEGHTGPVRCVAFDRAGTRALSGGDDGTVRLWDLDRRTEIKRLQGHRGIVRSVAFFPDGHFAASGGADGTVRVWDLRK